MAVTRERIDQLKQKVLNVCRAHYGDQFPDNVEIVPTDLLWPYLAEIRNATTGRGSHPIDEYDQEGFITSQILYIMLDQPAANSEDFGRLDDLV